MAALTSNPIFKTYIKNPNQQNLQAARNLFLSSAVANINYFQVRYINVDGMEEIRVEKPRNAKQPLLVTQAKLQDKSERYYFQEAKLLDINEYWYSRLDLNIEHGDVEWPLRPTIRVATPTFSEEKFAGIVIINAEISQLMSVLQNSPNFDVYIIDDEGYFLSHPNELYNWGRYLEATEGFEDLFPEISDKILSPHEISDGEWFSFNLTSNLDGIEELKLVFHASEKFVGDLAKKNYEMALYVGLLVLLISIPMGVLIGFAPARLQASLKKANEQNLNSLQVIDQYVVTSRTNTEGIITDVSSAFCVLSGYSREELIGEDHSILKSGSMPSELYENLWNTISKGKIWHGEIKNRTKYGESFWLDITILPEYQHQTLIGYKAVSHDITDKKIFESASEHDPLTGLYNRQKIDLVLEQEAIRVNRYQDDFSVILLDIDFFKIVNDKYGHPVGDLILCEIATILEIRTRTVDVVGRWGGEEFMILCLETPLQGAIDLSEKIRSVIEEHSFSTVGSITASFGVAQFKVNDKVSHFIKRVDDALYEAKQQGRNRVFADIDNKPSREPKG